MVKYTPKLRSIEDLSKKIKIKSKFKKTLKNTINNDDDSEPLEFVSLFPDQNVQTINLDNLMNLLDYSFEIAGG